MRMTEREVTQHLLHLASFKAQRLLDDPQFAGGLDALGVYDLVLMATDDPELASKLAGQRGRQRLLDDLPA